MPPLTYVNEFTGEGKLATKLRRHRFILYAGRTIPTAADTVDFIPGADNVTVTAVGLGYKASTASQAAFRASFFRITATSATQAILATVHENRGTAQRWTRRKATISSTNQSVSAGRGIRVKFPTVGSSVKGPVVAWVEYTID